MSELDMANVNDMASLHSTGLNERLGMEEEEAVSQLGWPSPVTEGKSPLSSHECLQKMTEVENQMKAFQPSNRSPHL